MDKIKIILVDDHPIIGEGLEFLLNRDPELQVMATTDNALKGLKLIKRLHPDVIILDLSMPQMDGLEAMTLYLETDQKIKIIIFSAYSEEKYVYQALNAGALGYVVKGATADELKQAIKFVQRGGYWVSSQFSRKIIEKYLQLQQTEVPEHTAYDSLTRREKQVFRLMVDGKQTEEIGELLFISASTVAKHRRAIMEKLELNNIAEMIKYAIRSGITQL